MMQHNAFLRFFVYSMSVNQYFCCVYLSEDKKTETPQLKRFCCLVAICGCQNGGICTAKDNRPYCECAAGFSGYKCEICKS